MTATRFNLLSLAASMILFAGCNSSTQPQTTAAPAVSTTPAKTDAAPSITSSSNEPQHAWTDEQILTCTVSQCWQLANRSEDTFFDIVQQLAVISAKNRGLTLPEDAEAGKKAGEIIKAQAKADHEALLFAVVDNAVRKVGKVETASAAK